jgi:hypothetical protein
MAGSAEEGGQRRRQSGGPLPRQGRVLFVLMALAAGMLMGVAGFFGWMWLVDNPSPMESQRLVRMEAARPDNGPAYLVAYREFCFRRSSEAEAARIFRRIPEVNEPEEVVETVPMRVHLSAGCHTRGRRIDLPDTMRPGRWTFLTGLRWCNIVGKCVTEWLPEIVLNIDDERGQHVIRVEGGG